MSVRSSLRGRLTLGVALVLAVVLAGAGAMVSRYVERSERAALDDRLRRTAELSRDTALRAVEQQLPAQDSRLDDVLSATGTSLRVLLGRRVLLASGAPPPASRPAPRDGLRTFVAGGEPYRAYTISLRPSALARLEVTTRAAPLEAKLRALDRRLLGFGALALLAAAAGAFLAADVLLRPLARLRAATAQIASTDDLDRRVAGDADRGPAELRSLASSFDAMLARLSRSAAARERALAATRRFAADAGHELRTPLTSVQATLSALSRHPELDGARRAQLLRDALGEQRRLVDLLDGLQALARGEVAPVELADVDLAELVATSVAAARARHGDVAWSTRLPDGAIALRGWEPGLRVLVDNLLENAARHGAGRVAVAVLADGDAVVLHVDDDGPGIAIAERARIFEPFVRAAGTVAGGSGLGLALVAQQAAAHGARVAVADAPLGGARFSVRFGARD